MFNRWFLPLEGVCTDTATAKAADKVATLDCLPIIFANLIRGLVLFAGLTALIMFILGSLKLLSSRGDPKKIQGAKNNFTYGVLGLVVIIFSYTILTIISIITGVPCIKTIGFGC
jgi:glucose uptake protein GlcU